MLSVIVIFLITMQDALSKFNKKLLNDRKVLKFSQIFFLQLILWIFCVTYRKYTALVERGI